MKFRWIAYSLVVLVVLSGSVMAEDGAKTATGFVKHENPPKETETIYNFYKETFGFVPNLAQVMSGSPALMKSYYQTQNNLRDHGKLSQAEINVVQMAIAVENKCSYCVAGHTMAGQVFFKTPMDVMQGVRSRQALNTPKLNALRNFAIQVYAERGQVAQQDLQTFLTAGYTRDQALDVVTCVAAKVMSNYTNALAKTELDEPLKPLATGLDFARK